MLSFADENLKSLFKGLKRPKGAKGTYPQVFFACVEVIDDVLEQYLVEKGVMDDIRQKNLPNELAVAVKKH